MFDLNKAYLDTFNPATGRYVRKDGLLKLIPDTKGCRELRHQVSKLLIDYPAKLVVDVVTNGYPKCPVCSKDITKQDAPAPRFIKTCGSALCQRAFISKFSSHAKKQVSDKLAEIHRLLPSTSYKFVSQVPGKARVVLRCVDCGKETEKHLCNLKNACECHRGLEVSKAVLGSKAHQKLRASKLKVFRGSLVSERFTFIQEHPTRSKAKIKCNDCGKVHVNWFSKPLGCSCRKVDKLKDARKQAVAKAKQELRDILRDRNITPLEKYRGMDYPLKVKCDVCERIWSSMGIQFRYFGCQHCAAVKSAPARMEAARASNLLKYGVEHSSQRPDVLAKMLSGRYVRKPYKLGKRVVHVQGYEPMALDYVLSKGVKPSQIKVGTRHVPRIPYILDGKKRMYFADFLVEREGKKDILVEVKSTYTYSVDRDKILAKEQAALDAGFDFRFLIFEATGTLVPRSVMDKRLEV